MALDITLRNPGADFNIILSTNLAVMGSKIQQVTVTGSGAGILALNPYSEQIAITWRVQQTNTPTYAVQGTLINILEAAASALDWFDLVSGATTDRDGSFVAPLNAIRINVTVVSASSTATLRVIQGM